MRRPSTGHLYNVDNYEKIHTILYTVLYTMLYTVLTRNYNINLWNLSTFSFRNYLQFSPYGCIVWSVSIQNGSLLSYHLGYNGQLFEHAYHQLNHCDQNKKNAKPLSLASVHEHLDYINSHLTCTE